MVTRHRSIRSGLGVGLALSGALCGSSLITETPAMAAKAFVAQGTNIGAVPTGAEFLGFVGSVAAGVDSPELSDPDLVADGTLVNYPASFWPVSHGFFADPTWNQSVTLGLNRLAADIAASGEDRVLIAGQSQGAVVASQYKVAHPIPAQATTYLLISNPGRPNGGFLERFNGLRIPILDVTMTGATPNVGGITYDVGRQYDGWSDFPKYPLNVLSTINAIAGIVYLHGVQNQVAQVDFAVLNDPSKTDIVVDGDTTYYTVATDRLPMLKIFEGFVPSPILTALDAPLRVIVEWGYDRASNPGTPAGLTLLRVADPVQDAANLTQAIRVGLDNGIAEASNDPTRRPFGTTPAGMYGVGGRQISPSPAASQEKQTDLASRVNASHMNTASVQQNSRETPQRKVGAARSARTAHKSAG